MLARTPGRRQSFAAHKEPIESYQDISSVLDGASKKFSNTKAETMGSILSISKGKYENEFWNEENLEPNLCSKLYKKEINLSSANSVEIESVKQDFNSVESSIRSLKFNFNEISTKEKFMSKLISSENINENVNETTISDVNSSKSKKRKVKENCKSKKKEVLSKIMKTISMKEKFDEDSRKFEFLHAKAALHAQEVTLLDQETRMTNIYNEKNEVDSKNLILHSQTEELKSKISEMKERIRKFKESSENANSENDIEALVNTNNNNNNTNINNNENEEMIENNDENNENDENDVENMNFEEMNSKKSNEISNNVLSSPTAHWGSSVEAMRFEHMKNWYESAIETVTKLTGTAIVEWKSNAVVLGLITRSDLISESSSSSSSSISESSEKSISQKSTEFDYLLTLVFSEMNGNFDSCSISPLHFSIQDIQSAAISSDNISFLVREVRARAKMYEERKSEFETIPNFYPRVKWSFTENWIEIGLSTLDTKWSLSADYPRPNSHYELISVTTHSSAKPSFVTKWTPELCNSLVLHVNNVLGKGQDNWMTISEKVKTIKNLIPNFNVDEL